MAYRKFTQCVSPGNFSPAPGGGDYAAAAAYAFTLYMALSTLISQTTSWTAALIALLISILTPLVMYCEWWLYGRLICLGGDRCAVGLLLTVEPPDEKDGFDRFDNDYSINLVLAPHTIGASQATVENEPIQGDLIKNQPAIQALGIGFEGETAGPPDVAETAVLHCEFEGAGVYDLYIAFIVALALAIAAGVAQIICMLGIPIISWIACIIAIILAVVALAVALIALPASLTDKGDPSDVGLAELQPGKDILVVEGEWVVDPVHGGWNELHPIKHAQWTSEWTGAWPDDIMNKADEWCLALAETRDALTAANQRKPENQWRIHPMVDSCEPEDEGGGGPPIPH